MSPEKQEHRNEPEQDKNAGFAEGQAETPDAEFKHGRHGHFSDGQAAPEDPETEHHGRFSEGQEQLSEHPRRIGHGGFGEGQREDS
jgi:hypothetical protein